MPTGHLEGVFNAMLELQRRKETDREYALAQARAQISQEQELRAEKQQQLQHEQFLAMMGFRKEKQVSDEEAKAAALQEKAGEFKAGLDLKRENALRTDTTRKEGIMAQLLPRMTAQGYPGLTISKAMDVVAGKGDITALPQSPISAASVEQKTADAHLKEIVAANTKAVDDSRIKANNALASQHNQATARSKALLPGELVLQKRKAAEEAAKTVLDKALTGKYQAETAHIRQTTAAEKSSQETAQRLAGLTGDPLLSFLGSAKNIKEVRSAYDDTMKKALAARKQQTGYIEKSKATAQLVAKLETQARTLVKQYAAANADPNKTTTINGKPVTAGDIDNEMQRVKRQLDATTPTLEYLNKITPQAEAEYQDAMQRWRTFNNALKRAGDVKNINRSTGKTVPVKPTGVGVAPVTSTGRTNVVPTGVGRTKRGKITPEEFLKKHGY